MYLPALRGRLGLRQFAPLDPPTFLDHERCEFVLVSTGRGVHGRLREGGREEEGMGLGRGNGWEGVYESRVIGRKAKHIQREEQCSYDFDGESCEK